MQNEQPRENPAATVAADLSDPLSQIEAEHVTQLAVCDLLEAIADGLPDAPDQAVIEHVVPILKAGFRDHMRIEDDILFPLLREWVPEQPALKAIIDQLEHEHEIDTSYGEELAQELTNVAFRNRVENPEMLGYMLRGFFELQRRHINWENKIMLPMARAVLTQDDMSALSSRLNQSDIAIGLATSGFRTQSS